MTCRNLDALCLNKRELPSLLGHRRIDRLNNNSGYTIIEVMIAIAIFSIGILGTASLQISSSRNIKTGNMVTQATMLAKDKIEMLKRVTDVTTLSDGSETEIDGQGNPGGIFNRSWTISNPFGGSDTRQITVNVSWNHNGENRSIHLATIIKN